jgi:hypothetical protein
VKLTIEEAPARETALKLRIPGWLRDGAASVRVRSGTGVSPGSDHGQDARATPKPGTYFEIARVWKPGDVVELSFDFAPTLYEANPLVEETLNQVAVRFGPIVYCVEANDLPQNVRLTDVALRLGEKPPTFASQAETIVNANVLTFSVPAVALQRETWTPNQLYRELRSTTVRPISLKLVPYFAWGNRGEADMTVWIPVR